MKTIAAVLRALREPLRIEELELPQLRDGQLIVEVAFSGVCHSQLLEVSGQRGIDRFLPHVLGHEGSGVVLECGPRVTKVKPGDRVVMSWIKGSGADVQSIAYRGSDGLVNSGAIATFMERTVTCESRVTAVPATVPSREAALLGCAIPTGAGIVRTTARLQAGQSVAIFGVGGIGLSAVMASAIAGAAPIIAVDVVDQKLQWARTLGATHTVNPQLEEPLAAILEFTDGSGVDCAIEAAGRAQTMELALRAVRDHGGLCILAGNLPHGGRISIDPFDLIRGKRLLGTWGGESDLDRDLPYYARLYLEGKLKLEALITHQYRLEQINQALVDLEVGIVGRALIDLGAGGPQ